MQNKDKDIIERKLGYSNAMMLEDLRIMHKVLTQKSLVKKGKVVAGSYGKKREPDVYEYKHDVPKEIIQRVERSIEYYKTAEEEPVIMDKPIKKAIELRDYQKNIVSKAEDILLLHGFVYLSMEVRTGKTLTSMAIAEELPGVQNVLFVTKKKLVPTKKSKGSVMEDYEMLCPEYDLVVINYESLHKIPDVRYDVVILDESHSMGAFPKPSKRAKDVKELLKKNKNPYVIFLSGTPTPESYSQMYHQVYGIPTNPFAQYSTFYKFAKDYVNVKVRYLSQGTTNDYSDGKPEILEKMKPYMISYTQQQAGFKSVINEHVIEVDMKPATVGMIQKLEKDLVLAGKEEVIMADTAVKLMQKVHQMYSGTIKFESGNSMVLDTSKAEFIFNNWIAKGHKIAIFYKFVAELEALQKVLGDSLTTDLGEFAESDKSIALQIVSGREGISLRQAEFLVYYNIDFSATSYWQSRDRMTTKDRPQNDVYWIFAKGGIEKQIYQTVLKKKSFTKAHYEGWKNKK